VTPSSAGCRMASSSAWSRSACASEPTASATLVGTDATSTCEPHAARRASAGAGAATQSSSTRTVRPNCAQSVPSSADAAASSAAPAPTVDTTAAYTICPAPRPRVTRRARAVHPRARAPPAPHLAAPLRKRRAVSLRLCQQLRPPLLSGAARDQWLQEPEQPPHLLPPLRPAPARRGAPRAAGHRHVGRLRASACPAPRQPRRDRAPQRAACRRAGRRPGMAVEHRAGRQREEGAARGAEARGLGSEAKQPLVELPLQLPERVPTRRVGVGCGRGERGGRERDGG
jgi:hypothetical protein